MKLRNRYISREKIRDNSVQYSSEKNIKEVTHVGLLKNGYVDGPVWEFLQGGKIRNLSTFASVVCFRAASCKSQ